MNDQTRIVEREPKVSAPARSLRGRIALVLLVAAATGGSATYWYLTKDIATTDDAFTDGRAVTVTPQVSGQVVGLNAPDNALVKAGDLLVEIDPRNYTAARDAAAARVAAAQAQLDSARIALDNARIDYPARLAAARAQLAAAQAVRARAQADFRRQQNLPRAATTQQEIDTANANLQSAEAQTAQAEAAVRQADLVPNFIAAAEAQVKQLDAQVALARADLATAVLNLSWTRITAPQDGWITKRNVERGTTVQPGQSLLALVTPEMWVTANFKESQLARMRPGQKVDISVDAYPALRLTGHVDSIQLGSGTRFTAFPPENATGNFVKIVQRIPVKIIIDGGLEPGLLLPLGLSVEPTVHLVDPPVK